MHQKIYTTNHLGKFIFHSEGNDLLRPAKISEVFPGKEIYYMRPPERNHYFLMSIPKETHYETIKNLVGLNYVWIKKEKNVRKKITQQGTQLRT